jgi:hypothetical protein
MAKINRSEPLEVLQSGLRLDTIREKTPLEVADKVLATYKINPMPTIKVIQGAMSDSVTTNILTSSTTKRTFITSLTLTIAKDSNSNSTETEVVAFLKGNGGGATIMTIKYEPTTAGALYNSLSFNPPLELQKGTTARVTNTSATASIDTKAILTYYEVEV